LGPGPSAAHRPPGTRGISPLDFRDSSLSAVARPPALLECVHRQRTTNRRAHMITAFFTFVTLSFFAAITANVAETIGSL
jgi:hypothetical protein